MQNLRHRQVAVLLQVPQHESLDRQAAGLGDLGDQAGAVPERDLVNLGNAAAGEARNPRRVLSRRPRDAIAEARRFGRGVGHKWSRRRPSIRLGMAPSMRSRLCS